MTAQAPLERGFAGALKGCEEWVLKPASWADGIVPFLASVGLGNTMGLVETVPAAVLPPKNLRVANHYWRINSAPDAGYFLIVSDRLPICHITGGGAADLQPVVETVLASASFKERWKKVAVQTTEDMISTHYRHRETKAFEIVISRARMPRQRTDRVQVLATANFKLKK